jgi:hypothetical protein
MKKCPYCGAEYPDDATACAIDQTPFGEVPSEASPRLKLPTFAIFSEYKIPVSLSIVSYLFFFPGAMCFAFIALAILLLFLPGGSFASGIMFLPCLIGGAYGFFCLCLSRGLRRCSRGWRTCALVIIWWGFIVMAFGIGRYLLTHKTPSHETTIEFLAGYAFGFVVQVWQYRVLTRPDIRDLFYGYVPKYDSLDEL